MNFYILLFIPFNDLNNLFSYIDFMLCVADTEQWVIVNFSQLSLTVIIKISPIRV